MIDLKLFGSIDLRDKRGTRLQTIINQPRRLGLLAYMAVEAHGRPVRRDTLIGVFWPEVSQERAGRALTQALHFLRKAMGEPGVLADSSNQTVELNPRLFKSDVSEFRQSLQEGDFEAASRAYRGDFMEGFHLEGINDFEDWQARLRATLRHDAATAAFHLAQAMLAQGQLIHAATNARLAARLRIEDEAFVREQLKLLVAVSDYAGAASLYAEFATFMEAEFESSPSLETFAIIRNEQDRGIPQAATQTNSFGTVEPPTKWWHQPALWAGSIAVMLMVISLWGLVKSKPVLQMSRQTTILNITDIAVTESGLGSIRQALQISLMAKLTGSTRLAVRSGEPSDHIAPSEGARYTLRTSLDQENNSIIITGVLVDQMSATAVEQAFIRVPKSDDRSVDKAGTALAEFARRAIGRELERRPYVETNGGHLIMLANRARMLSDSLRGASTPKAALEALDVADSLYREAETQITVRSLARRNRAEIAIRSFWLNASHPLADLTTARRSLAFGDSIAVAMGKDAPADAYLDELSGIFSYWRWQYARSESEAEHEGKRALRHLQSAVARDPTRARAWSYLSGILFTRGDYVHARFAAEQAYNADVFLEFTNELLVRLFFASVETNDLKGAKHWHDEIARANPNSWIEAYSRLALLAAPATVTESQLDTATMVLSNSYSQHYPSPLAAHLHMLFSVIVAKSGDVRAARAAASLAQTMATDDELEPLSAWFELVVGNRETARQILRSYVATAPAMRKGLLRSNRFVNL